jgi:mediator of RNA polymerase II transcription subunit 14
MRLNLDDYDSIPSQFRNYTIKDGRVTFKVAGEFEVDLTVADENPESQYWFIDLRFLFNPSLSVLNPRIRNPINYRVDEILKQDGLAGCYKYLHEMILTHKISEFRRQAIDLARGRWAETLKVEALNRALSIQYWVDRFPKVIKSWIILGVHSGRRKDGRPDPKATSRLSIRWFRDGKEVKDVDISFDSINISTESLLRTVIAKHVSHLMTALHETMRTKPLYVDRDLALTLSISPTEPAESELKIQLTSKQLLSIKMEPITGRFVFSPASGRISGHENALNNTCPSPATEGHTVLDRLRYALVTEDFESRGLTVGWIRTRNPGIRQDVLKERLHKDTMQVLWFRRQGWVKDWHLAVSLGMFGEHWQLFETYVSSTLLDPRVLTILVPMTPILSPRLVPGIPPSSTSRSSVMSRYQSK